MTTIQVRVDDDLKIKSDLLFKELGTDTTSAIRMFLAQAIAHNGFPFEIKKNTTSNPYKVLSEEEILLELEDARKSIELCNVKTAKEIFDNLKAKYDL